MSSENKSQDPRNSWVRGCFKPVVDRGAEFVVKNTGLTANHITLLGNALVAVGTYQAYRANRPDAQNAPLQRANALVSMGIGSAFDALDGAVARLHAELNPNTIHSSDNGQIIDAFSDRGQEIIMGISRIVQAYERGDRIGQIAASVVTLMQPIPSLLKCIAESKGRMVPEAGHSKIDLPGTRAGRAITNTAGTVFPQLQKPLDGITAISTVRTIYQRAETVFRPPDSTLDVLPEDIKDKAKTRMWYMAGAALLSIGSVGVLITLKEGPALSLRFRGRAVAG